MPFAAWQCTEKIEKHNMSAIKDIHDLTAGLINSVTDRRIASELAKIQSAVSAFQSEHFEARERNVNLLADNLHLQQEVRDLVSRHATEMEKIKAAHSEKIAKLKKESEDAITGLHEQYADPNRNSSFGCGDIPNVM